MITHDARCTRENKSRTAMAKAAFNKKKTLLTSKLDLNLRKKAVKCYIWSIFCMVLKRGNLRKSIRNTCNILKCNAGEERRRLVGPIV
jgi:hypothetical protein